MEVFRRHPAREYSRAMRLMVYGPGGVGGSLAGGLIEAGHRVQLVGRGAHRDAVVERGLSVSRPEGTKTYAIEIARSAAESVVADLDAVLLCVKSQDTVGALDDLLEAGGPKLPIVCCQNGVTNERVAAERFENVYGMMVWMPASHMAPGRVAVFASEPPGVLRIGRFPAGVDELAQRLAQALSDGGFGAEAVEDIDAWKHAKLLANLGNAIDAFCKPVPKDHPFRAALEAETRAVFAAAGVSVLPRAELDAATEGMHLAPVDGERRSGGSTWQSAARGLPNEVDHLNGWVCELGDRHGIATPHNRALVELARSNPAPRSVDLETILIAG